MSDYIVSARKYRPDSFESLIGQDNIARTLKNSILRGQLAHAYLFCGPRGVGKTSAARIFAKTINCSNPGPEMQPCGECESCKSFREGRSYCIHELDAASNNGVDDIKTLMDQVQIPPQTGRYSVYIIDEVHMLSSAAFNAFLKTLEEPPAHAIFILATTEKHKIIPTILSRCQTYDFNRISIPDIVRNLRDIASKEQITIDDESLHIIAHKADGAMRDALTIFDQTVAFCGTNVAYEDVLRNLNVLDYEYSFRLVDAFLAGDYASALLIFDEILAKGFNALYFVTSLGSHLRDLLVSRTGGLEALLELPDSLKSRYAEQAARCSVRFLYNALDICTKCEAGYRASSNQRLHIEFSLMKLAFIESAPAVSASQQTGSQPQTSVSTRSSASAAPTSPIAPTTNLPQHQFGMQLQPTQAQSTQHQFGVQSQPIQQQATQHQLGVQSQPTQAQSTQHQLGVQSQPTQAQANASASSSSAALAQAQFANQPQNQSPAQPHNIATSANPTHNQANQFPATANTNSSQSTSVPASATDVAAPKKRSASSLSLSSLMEGSKESKVAIPETPVVTNSSALPSDELLTQKWSDLVATFSQSPRLANALRTAKLAFREEEGRKVVEFSVVNVSQKEWIEEKILRELEARYCKILNTSAVIVKVDVIPDEQLVEKKYMPAEKAAELIDKNPEVRNFVAELALDVK